MLRLIFVSLIIAFGTRYALKGAFGALLLYLWIAYFRPHLWAHSSAIIGALDLSLFAGVYLLVRSIASNGDRFRFDFRTLLLLIFIGLSFVSTLLSTQSTYAWPFLVEFAKAIAVSYLLAVLVTDATKFRTALLVIALSLGFEAAKQGWQQLIFNPGGSNQNPLPMLGDNNGVAVGMLMLVTLFLALAQTAQKQWEQWMHRFFLLGVTYRAIVTYSRGGFLAAAALGIVYIVRSKQRFRAAVGIAVVAMVILPVLPQTFWDRMSTMKVTSEDQISDDSARSRLHFWRVATIMANQNPVFGVGYNAFNRTYDEYDTLNGRYGRGRSVHSMWFGVLAELGYPALIVYITIMVMAVIGSGGVANRAARGEIPKEFFYYGVAIQTAFAAGLVGGSFLPWQYTELLWHFVGLSMALRWIALDPAHGVAAAAPERARPLRVKTIFQPNPATRRARVS